MTIRELNNALKPQMWSTWRAQRVVNLKPLIGEDIYYFPGKGGVGDEAHILGFCACKFSQPIRQIIDRIEDGIRHEESESVS